MTEMLVPQPCPADRVESVIHAARDNLFAGMVNDPEAIDLCVKMGLVRVVIPTGVGGLMGLGKLEIVR